MLGWGKSWVQSWKGGYFIHPLHNTPPPDFRGAWGCLVSHADLSLRHAARANARPPTRCPGSWSRPGEAPRNVLHGRRRRVPSPVQNRGLILSCTGWARGWELRLLPQEKGKCHIPAWRAPVAAGHVFGGSSPGSCPLPWESPGAITPHQAWCMLLLILMIN